MKGWDKERDKKGLVGRRVGRSCGWVGYNVRGTAAREPRATTPRHMAEAAGVAAIDGSARTQLAKENSRQVSCYGRTQCDKY